MSDIDFMISKMEESWVVLQRVLWVW